MADTSFGERVWIVQGVEQDIRTDGRSRSDYRPLQLEANIIAQADGSARLHLGATDVLVGIKVCDCNRLLALPSPQHNVTSRKSTVDLRLSWYNICQLCCRLSHLHQVELGSPDSSAPDQGQVQVSVECSSCASPEFKVRRH